MRKMLLAKLTSFFILAFFLAPICAPRSALAGIAPTVVTIRAGSPETSGTMTLRVKDLKTGLYVDASVTVVPADHCWGKAKLLQAALATAIAADPVLSHFFTVDPYKGGRSSEVTVNRNGDNNGVEVAVVDPDETGESDTLKINGNPAKHVQSVGSNDSGPNWFWTFVMWLAADSNTVVPNGTFMTMAAKEPSGNALSVSVTGNGVLTVAQLQQQAISQFQALGINFTPVTDPETGRLGFMSQSFAGTKQEGGGSLHWNGKWSTYLGTGGVTAAPPQ